MAEKTNNELMLFNPEVAPIEEKNIELVINDAEEISLYAKPVETGEFQIGEELQKNLVGRVTGIDRYGGKWEDNTLIKIRDVAEKDLPVDFELRADVSILTQDYRNIIISLSPSSYKYHFAPFVKQLKSKGITITDVMIIFSVKMVNSKKGAFAVVIPRIHNPPKPIKLNCGEDYSSQNDSGDDADIPF